MSLANIWKWSWAHTILASLIALAGVALCYRTTGRGTPDLSSTSSANLSSTANAGVTR